MEDLNVFSAVAAAIAAFVFGALWYSPLTFLPMWIKAAELEDHKPPPQVFGISFVMTIVSALVLAALLGPSPSLADALTTSLLLGAGLVMASMGINYQFADRGTRLWLIDGGFQIGRFMVMGVVLALL
ncbi:DUF1761 domain-containing protein [Marinobacterium jannaschii]|uniref:DUF1761 domain-containing protein n=1 Tax=Marinobacterium jannaschii TaxID=64970 RepID=UPI000480F30D|nr:DUF1761 domain-containing protein [Marinobacterium jannaschii]